MDDIAVVAVTNVTYGGHIHRPGARLALPAPNAHALAAGGYVRIEEPEAPAAEPAETPETPQKAAEAAGPPPLQTSARGGPAADRDVSRPQAAHQGAAGPPAAPIPLERVSGIGPSTARRLREAGVDVEALAAMTDARAAELRVREPWRDQARRLAGVADASLRTGFADAE